MFRLSTKTTAFLGIGVAVLMFASYKFAVVLNVSDLLTGSNTTHGYQFRESSPYPMTSSSNRGSPTTQNSDWNTDRTIVILYWTKFFGASDWLGAGERVSLDRVTGKTCRCNFTGDKSRIDVADFVFFHAFDVDTKRLPTSSPRRRGQLWAVFLWECPAENGLGDDRLLELKSLFNLSGGYSTEDDLFLPYGQCTPLGIQNGALGMQHGSLGIQNVGATTARYASTTTFTNTTANILSRNFAKSKTKRVVWFVSHCKTRSRREDYVTQLRRHIDVDVYGKCGNLTCDRDKNPDCFDVLEVYKFYLAFENSICDDYVTEKAFKTLLDVAIVPVVLGAANYSRHLPPNSFIDVRDFTSPKQLAKYLLYLDSNDTAYNTYLAWRGHYRCADNFAGMRHKGDVCPQVHQLLTQYQLGLANRVSTSAQVDKTWKAGVKCRPTMVKDHYEDS